MLLVVRVCCRGSQCWLCGCACACGCWLCWARAAFSHTHVHGMYHLPPCPVQRERLRRNKVEYDRRVAREELMRQSKEDEVSRLEALEMQLIERLKKTQARQQKAYHDLESALASAEAPVAKHQT